MIAYLRMIEDDDPIIEEIPVYLSKNAKNLSVCQFPLQNGTKCYSIDKSTVANCCVKPLSQQLKIDFKLDTASQNYDAFKGKTLAELADGNKSSSGKVENPSFESGRMDKASFTSSVSVKESRYALGVLLEKELHLVPVQTFFQMRQTYSYFDKGDKRTKAEEKEGSDEEPEDLKQVTVKFARSGDAEKIKRAREKSYQFVSSIGSEEKWCQAMIYPKDSLESQIERHKIPSRQSIANQFTSISSNEYFSDLISDEATLNVHAPEEENEIPITTMRSHISKKQVKKLALLEQIKIFLRDAKVLTFNRLMEMLSDPQLSSEKVVRHLALCGVMLKGNWTLQSEILYPAGFVSLTNGVSHELLCRGRDYVLFKLMRNELSLLNRHKISLTTQLPQEETKEVLESVAFLKSTEKGKVWELLNASDINFEKRHHDIVQRQDAFWKAQEEKFLEMELEKTEKRARKKSLRESKS